MFILDKPVDYGAKRRPGASRGHRGGRNPHPHGQSTVRVLRDIHHLVRKGCYLGPCGQYIVFPFRILD